MKGSKGFTLIELMIVIAILGILASLAIPSYQAYVIRAKLGEPIQIVSALKPAIMDHYASKGTMPAVGTTLLNSARDGVILLDTVSNAAWTANPGNPNELTLGVEVADLGGTTGNPSSNQISFKFSGSSTGMTLVCSTSAGSTIDPRYLSEPCRN